LLAPLLLISRHSSPSLATYDRPVAGTLNELFQGSAFPSLKVPLAIRLLPDSLGTFIPGDPLVGAALQSAGSAPAAAGAAGAAGGLREATQPRERVATKYRRVKRKGRVKWPPQSQ